MESEIHPKKSLFSSLVDEGGSEFRRKMIFCARNKDLNPAEVFG